MSSDLQKNLKSEGSEEGHTWKPAPLENPHREAKIAFIMSIIALVLHCVSYPLGIALGASGRHCVEDDKLPELFRQAAYTVQNPATQQCAPFNVFALMPHWDAMIALSTAGLAVTIVGGLAAVFISLRAMSTTRRLAFVQDRGLNRLAVATASLMIIFTFASYVPVLRRAELSRRLHNASFQDVLACLNVAPLASPAIAAKVKAAGTVFWNPRCHVNRDRQLAFAFLGLGVPAMVFGWFTHVAVIHLGHKVVPVMRDNKAGYPKRVKLYIG